MEPAHQLKVESYVTEREIDRVTHTWGNLEGLQTVPKCVRTWIPFCTAWIKLGYRGFWLSFEALVGAQYRANPRANKSVRSGYNAMKWLEEAGYIRRQKFRIGENRFKTKITFRRSRFAFFLKKGKGVSYNAPQVQNMHYYKKSNNNRTSESVKGVFKSNNCNNNAKQEREKTHPVLYSCKYVLINDRDKTGFAILNRIKQEIAGKMPESVPWASLEAKWHGMLHEEREYESRNVILPAVRHAMTHTRVDNRLDDLVSQTLRDPTTPSYRHREIKTENNTTLNDAEFRLLYWASRQ